MVYVANFIYGAPPLQLTAVAQISLMIARAEVEPLEFLTKDIAASYRNIEQMMLERGINVDHSTIHRWVVHYAPQLEKEFTLKIRKPRGRWRLDETYIKVKGQMRYQAGMSQTPAELFYAVAG